MKTMLGWCSTSLRIVIALLSLMAGTVVIVIAGVLGRLERP